MEFREATVTESIDFLRKKAKELAHPHELNIAYIGRKPTDARITLSLTNIPLMEVLKIIAHQAGLTVRTTDHGIYLYPKDEQPEL